MIKVPVATLVAFGCAALMGLAVQRGGTCAVAAVEEVVVRRDTRRFRALVEAACWSAGLLATALLVLGHAVPVRAFGVTEWTVVGGVLLGVGAWINGACVFGSVAAVGGGDWAYVFFPVGFLLGCVSFAALATGVGPVGALPQVLPAIPRFQQYAPVVAGLFGCWALVRAWHLWAVLFRREGGNATDRAPFDVLRGEWPLHVGTIVVAVAFVLMALAFGHWVYTDALAELARGQTSLGDVRVGLFGAMLFGSLVGGISLRKWCPVALTANAVGKCLLGGWVMAFGFLLVPGANDSIILLGLPTLQPHAWLSMVVMCLTIAGLIVLKRRWQMQP